MKSKSYTVEQLLHNPSFIRWVKADVPRSEDARWDRWVKQSEQNRRTALAAQKKMLGFAFEAPALPDVQEEWDKVQQEIIAKRRLDLPELLLDRSWDPLGIFLKVAAVLLIGVFAGLAVYVHQQPVPAPQKVAMHTVQTNYGEKKPINLSDGSAIILAAKSTLSYKANWLEQPVKRVQLKGEAFFSIVPQKTKEHPKLVVETEDGSAAVWGTRFTVNTYGTGSRVVLEKGEVRVQAKDAKNEVTMTPGQMARFSKSAPNISVEAVNPRVYTSWARNELFFDHTPLSVLVNRMKWTYGVEVAVKDPEILKKKLSGSVDFRSLDGLIASVSEVLGIQINKRGNTLIINQNEKIKNS